MSTIQERLRQARLESGLTQQQLADAVGVHVKSVSDWENFANPKKATLEGVAAALNLPTDHFLGKPDTTKDVVTIIREAKREIGLITGLGDDDFKLQMVL
jgi:transcriptional regulator with XRE-family HTH domain